MKKIYIAGKVTGEDPQQCRDKFLKAKKEVEILGFEVVNPMELVKDINTPWKEAMKTCIRELMTVDAVFLLPCHQNSPGAKLELDLAKRVGIPGTSSINFLKLLL